MKNDKIKLLFIEDNSTDAAVIKTLLNKVRPNRFVIDWVCTLKDAITCLQNDEYEIVLSDLFLPDSEGSNVITAIQKQNSRIPIVILSGEDSDEIALHVVQVGAQDYLVKGQGDGHLISRSLEYAIERKRIEHGLSFLAQYDSLTGLANRVLFRERLNRALVRADRNKLMVALIFIDLDRFKNINDSLGHDAGDHLLIEVGKRFTDCMREGDTIARLGGDEFTIVLEDVKQIEDVSIIAHKILNTMIEPFNIDGHEIYISPSIGITLYPIDDMDENNLLKNADAAMYKAKEGGRNCFRFYTADMNEHLVEKMQLEAKLRRAIENKEFQLHYQPKFNINSNEVIGAEALLRWYSPKDGMISPAQFIPLAEETGLINSITDWVVREASKQNSSWQKQGYMPIRMAINLSPRQFNQPNIARTIFNQIICSDLAPKYIELEITEGALMEDTERSSEILNELKKRGIHISIDDFGTGYSSLSYLKKFPLDTLKIDQSFVRGVMEDPDDAAIVSAVIAMGRSLRLNVIAEGVETVQQLNFLAAKGCNEAQGYLLGKPVPAKEFTQFLTKKNESIKLKMVSSA